MRKTPPKSILEGQEEVKKLKERGEIDLYIQPLVDAVSKYAVTNGSCSGLAYGYHLHQFEDAKMKPEIMKKIRKTVTEKPDITKKFDRSNATVSYEGATDSSTHFIFEGYKSKNEEGKPLRHQIEETGMEFMFNKYEGEGREIYYIYIVEPKDLPLGLGRTIKTQDDFSVESLYQKSFDHLKRVKRSIDILANSRIFDESYKTL